MPTAAPPPVQSTSFKFRGKQFVITGFLGEYIYELVSRTGKFYEDDLLDVIGSLQFPKDELIVDVGANIGNHTLYFGAFFENEIYAIEPVKSNFDLLVRNIELNSLEERVSAIQSVVWDHASEFTMVNHNPANGGTFEARESDSTNESVPGTTLSEILGNRRIALLKIDVEGAESRVLAGGLPQIRRDLPYIVAESHSPEAYRSTAELLLPIGYEIVTEGGRSTNYLWAHPDSSKIETLPQLRRRIAIDNRRNSSKRTMIALDRISNKLTELSSPKTDSTLSDHQVLLTGIELGLENSSQLMKISKSLADVLGDIRDSSSKLGEAVLRDGPAIIEQAVDRAISRETSKTPLDQSNRLAVAVEELHKALDEREKFETSAVAWKRAYTHLASKWESGRPGGASAAAAIDAVREAISARGGADVRSEPQMVDIESTRELSTGGFKRTDTVRIGIATMPGREKGLKVVLESLLTQADEIFVYINGSETAPTDVAYDGRVRFFTGPDYGDRGKFLFVEGFEGYYLTCDDDIEYPDFYVDYMVDGIERYGRKAIVGWHGSIFSDDFEDYYNSKYRRVLSFSTLRGKDTPVHLLGTGIAGFHTTTLPVAFDDFEHPNMADAFLARKAQVHQVPMVVLRHEKGWATPIEADAPSISNASLGKGDAVEKFDVRKHVSQLVKDHGTWSINEATAKVVRESLNVAIIGRTDRARWKKGGILKSCHLTASLLQQFGANVVLSDIETGDPQHLGGANVSVVMIYVGDPERPDFDKVENLIHHHAGLGRVVMVNLSVNGKSTRNEHIQQRLLAWEALYGNRVTLMVFTEAMHGEPGLAAVKHLLVTIPKTLALPLPPSAEFHTSEGIFVGDIAKLSDRSLMSHSANDWLKAIRTAVPEAPIYAVRQYNPRFDVALDIDEVWPFMQDEFSRRVSRMRVMVAPVKFATFEMVPVEVASLGVPVVYQQMPQSLTEYLGLAGVQVQTPAELESVLPMLYRDPLVWRSQSRAGRLRAKSADLQSAAGQMYMKIATLSKRSVMAGTR